MNLEYVLSKEVSDELQQSPWISLATKIYFFNLVQKDQFIYLLILIFVLKWIGY